MFYKKTFYKDSNTSSMVQESTLNNSNPAGESLTSKSSNTGEKSGTKYPWAVFLALAMGMLVYGVAESYGPVTALTGALQNYAYLGFSLPYIAGGVGALFSGALADRIGRKGSFMVTVGMILIGVAIYAIHNIIALIVSFILVGMAAIGLETPVLSMIAESVPAHLRGKSLVIVQNFGNIGVALMFVPYLLISSYAAKEAATILLFSAPLVALLIAWGLVRESEPWSAIKGKKSIDVEDAWQEQDGKAEPVKPAIGVPMRFFILIIIGMAQDVAFIYFTYTMGYTYFFSMENLIAVIGGLTMTAVGVIFGILFVERISRKSFTIFSYGILVGFWGLMWVFEALTHSTGGLVFLTVVALLFIPGEVTWASRGMLEPELFPTGKRGTYISLVRFVVWGGAGVINGILNFYILPFVYAAAIVMLVFILSLVMTIVWQIKGFETRSKSLSGLDTQIPKTP